MSINNLHSLLSGKWFIEGAYAKSLLPSLSLVLQGEIKEQKKEDITTFISASTGKTIDASVIFSEDNTEDYVSIISLKSPIYKYDQACGPRGTKSVMQKLNRLSNESGCKGVVLDIDSGGGQVSGTPELHDAILNFSKPIVAYTDGYMCSAAYYIGAATNHIVANKRADHIGSIGTMISFVDLTGYYEKQGAKVITEYATKSTEKNRNFENLLAGKPEDYIKNELDPINETFHEDIKNARPDISEEVFAGATWNGPDALDKKLIDQLGTLEDAINKVIELSNNNKSKTQNNMSTQRERIQAVLGLEEPLATTDNGSYLNEAQLDSIEEQLTANADTIATLTAQLEEAQNASSEDLQVAQTTIAGIETSVNSMLEEAGLDVQGTLDEKVDSLSAKVTEMANADGAAPTKVKTKEKSAAEVSAFQIDANASHNQIANNLHN